MNRIQQTNRWNCGSACLAMLFGTTVEDIEQNVIGRQVGKLKDPQDGSVIGVCAFEIEKVLWDRGIRYVRIEPRIHNPESEDWYGRVIGELPLLNDLPTFISAHFYDGRRAMLGVASLNNSDSSHWIVTEGLTIHDPSPNIKYPSNINDLEAPLEVREAFLLA